MRMEEYIILVESDRKKYKDYQMACSRQFELCNSLKKQEYINGAYNKELKQLEDLQTEYDRVKDNYSKRIFTVLSEQKPNLKVRKTGAIIPWNSAFADNYELLSIEQIRALIPLIEEDGGMYRISEQV